MVAYASPKTSLGLQNTRIPSILSVARSLRRVYHHRTCVIFYFPSSAAPAVGFCSVFELNSMMEGLKVSDANLTVFVHPSRSLKVSEAVLRELGSMLLKYDERFEGVLLAYEAKITDKTAKILSGVHPYFGVTLKAKLLLFSPKPDMLLEGKVVKLRQESIHVIVLGFASAVITDEDVREEFKHRTKHEEEMFVSSSDKHHMIKVGTMIRFLVKSFDEEILHISGSLVPSHTGSIQWLGKNSIDGSVTNRNTKKMRHYDGESLLQDIADAETGAFKLNYSHQSKSKKQKISRVS